MPELQQTPPGLQLTPLWLQLTPLALPMHGRWKRRGTPPVPSPHPRSYHRRWVIRYKIPSDQFTGAIWNDSGDVFPPHVCFWSVSHLGTPIYVRFGYTVINDFFSSVRRSTLWHLLCSSIVRCKILFCRILCLSGSLVQSA